MAVPGIFGIVLAGGEGKRLLPLTLDRAKPAVPFGGNYRLVDFALSNLVNAGYLKIAVLTQYKSHSLDRHITTTWRLSPLLGNYVTPVPAQQRRGPHWFSGSADAIYQSLNLIYDERPEYVCVFGADHIYRMDPGADGRAAHRDRRRRHGRRAARAAGRGEPLRRDRARGRRASASRRSARSRRTRTEDPKAPGQVLASMGNYVFTTERADRRGHARRAQRRLAARSRRRHHPDARRARRGLRLRLHEERGARRQRARSRLLARRRDARRLPRRAHGPDLGAAGVQPLQLATGRS